MFLPFFSFSDTSLSRLASILKASLLYVHTQIFNNNNSELVGLFKKGEKSYVIRKIILTTNSSVSSIATDFNASEHILLSLTAVATDKTNIYTLDNSNFEISASNTMLNISFSDIKNTGNVFDISIVITYGVENADSTSN